MTSRLEFRQSPAKNLGLLLLGLALVAMCAFTARIGDDVVIRGVGWFGVLFFGLAVVKAIRNLASKEVMYVFDDRGIEDRQSGVGLIPWSAITNVEVQSYRGTRFLVLSLDQPEHYRSRLSATQQQLTKVNQSLGFGDWCLAFVGTSPGIEEAEKFVATLRRE